MKWWTWMVVLAVRLHCKFCKVFVRRKIKLNDVIHADTIDAVDFSTLYLCSFYCSSLDLHLHMNS